MRQPTRAPVRSQRIWATPTSRTPSFTPSLAAHRFAGLWADKKIGGTYGKMIEVEPAQLQAATGNPDQYGWAYVSGLEDHADG